MELEKYVDELDREELAKSKYEFEEKDLIPKQSMLLTSVFGGVIGVDRYVLGNKVFGVAKGITFTSLLISLMTVTWIISVKVMEAYSHVQGYISITWADNVAVVGQGMANLVYTLIALLIGYILFVIVDGYLCYNKNLKINCKILKKQIEK